MTQNRSRQLILLLLLSHSILIMNVSALNYSVGIRNGDWVKYDVTFSNSTTTVNGSLTIRFGTVVNTRIAATYEANVTGLEVTERPQDFSVDILGEGSYKGCVIPAGLSEGEVIPGEYVTVESIVEWNGSRRAVSATATSPFWGFRGEMYWDQDTGILLEANSQTEEYYEIKVADTSVWSGFRIFGLNLGFDWMLWTAAITLIIAIIVVVALVHRRRKRAETSLS